MRDTIFIESASTDLLGECAACAASVLVAAAPDLAALARRRPGRRPDLSALRTIVALGSPMTGEARARLYAWVKPDILLLAQAGALLWGSPLDPVPREPGPPVRFFHP